MAKSPDRPSRGCGRPPPPTRTSSRCWWSAPAPTAPRVRSSERSEMSSASTRKARSSRRRRPVRRTVAAGSIVLLALGACARSVPRVQPTSPAALPPSPSPSPPAAAPSPLSSGFRPSHVVIVVMENKEYGSVIGNPDAPYVNGLARRYGLATAYFAVSHPSLPNYLALVGGSTF